MKRYLIALFLILTLTITPIDFDVSAAENTESSGRVILESLDIETSVYDKEPSAFVTREEFLMVLMNLIKLSSSENVDIPFTDVSPEISGALSNAVSLGVVSASDTFAPSRDITYPEAIKMAVSLLGYNYEASLKGGYPTGYLMVAHRIKLDNDIDVHDDSALTVSDFYTLIENVVTVEMLDPVGVSQDGIMYQKGTSLLEKYYNLYEIEGTVTANEFSGLYDIVGASEESVEIDGIIYKYVGIAPLGSNVRAYVEYNSNKIKIIVPTNNRELAISFDDIIDFTDNSFTYQTDDKEKKISLHTPLATIYNGKSDGTAKLTDYAGKDGKLVFIDNDFDGVYEVCNIYDYKYIYAGTVNKLDSYITDDNGNLWLDLSNDDLEYSIAKDGVEVNLSDVESNTLLSYTESKDKLLYTINIETKTVEGTVTEVGTSDKHIYIDDTTYEYGKYFADNYLSDIKIGDTSIFLLSSDGLIQAMGTKSQTEMQYGYLFDIASNQGLDSTVMLKLCNAKGELVILTLADKVTLEGESGKSAKSILEEMKPTNEFERQLIRYKQKSDGTVDAIDTLNGMGTLSGNEDDLDNLVQYQFPDDVYTTIHYTISSGIIHPYFAVSPSTLIMTVANSSKISEDKACIVRNKNYLATQKQFRSAELKAYNVSEDGVAEALLIITEETSGNDLYDNSPCGIVDSISKAVNPDGDEAHKIVVYTDSYYHDYYISDEDVLKHIQNDDGTIKLNKGDFVRYNADSLNNITAIEISYDSVNKKVNKTFENHIYPSLYYGRVYSKSDSYLSFMPDNMTSITPGAVDGIKYTFMIPTKIVIYDSETQKISQGTADNILTYTQVGNDECSRLLIFTDDGAVKLIVLYR